MRTRSAGFTLIEILFAIAILGVGIVGILSLFISGISAASWAGSRSAAAMEAQSMFGQVVSFEDPLPANAGKRLYLERMKSKFFTAPPDSKWISDAKLNVWVHNSGGTVTPEPVAAGSDFSWQCLAANYMLPKDSPLTTDTGAKGASAKPNASGLVEVVIAIYKSYRPGKEPISVYSTLLTLETR
jgi:prepilin-type N-terminal cleavage/methylation domain-containing protein